MQEDFLTYTSCGQRKIPEPELPTASDSVLHSLSKPQVSRKRYGKSSTCAGGQRWQHQDRSSWRPAGGGSSAETFLTVDLSQSSFLAHSIGAGVASGDSA